ncbi:MAG: PH domain-containing protein [Patescibacteria group bacterium]
MRDLSKIHFPGQDAHEQIVMATRRHPVTMVVRFFLFILGAGLPVGLYVALNQFTTWLDDTAATVYVVLVLVASCYYLIILLLMYHSWVNYYLDLWVVTTERVINIEQRGIFSRVVSELRLDRIQDVSSEVSGVLASLFRYGTIQLQTASETTRFSFRQIPHPERAAREILELHEQYVKTMGAATVQPPAIPPHADPAV